MGYVLGKGSLQKLERVQPYLAEVVKRAIEITAQDFSVVCGARSTEEQAAAVARGASRTMYSAHIPGEDGYSRAVDLAPWVDGKFDWLDREKFQAIADAMFAAADELGVLIQWGADWDCDGVRDDRQKFAGKRPIFDMPHFQLPPKHRVEAAMAEAARRKARRSAP